MPIETSVPVNGSTEPLQIPGVMPLSSPADIKQKQGDMLTVGLESLVVAEAQSTFSTELPVAEQMDQARLRVKQAETRETAGRNIVSGYNTRLLEVFGARGDVPPALMSAVQDSLLDPNDAVAPYLARIRQADQSGDLSPATLAQQKNRAVSDYLNATTQQMLEGISTDGKVLDAIQAFVAPTESKDIADFVDGNIFNFGSQLDKVASFVQTLPAELRLRLLPHLADKIWKASDGDSTSVNILTKVFSPVARDNIHFDAIFDQASLATAGLGLLRMRKMVDKEANSVSIVAEDDPAVSAASVKEVIDNPSAQDKIGLDAVDAKILHHPIEAVDEVDNHNKPNVSGFLADMDETEQSKKFADDVQDLQNIDQDIHIRGALTRQQIEDIKADGIREWEADLKGSGKVVDRAEIIDSDGLSFTMGVDLSDGQSLTKVVTYTDDMVTGQRVPTQVGVLESKAASPLDFIGKIITGGKENVRTALRLGMQGSMVSDRLVKATNTMLQGMSKKDIKILDEILILGDKNPQVFTRAQLMGVGIDTSKGRVKLNQEGYNRYLQARAMFDLVWDMENITQRRQLQARRMKGINTASDVQHGLGKGGEANSMGAPIDDLESARKQMPESVYTTEGNGGFKTLKDGELDDLYDKGYRLVKLESDMELEDGLNTAWIIAKQGQGIGELPAHVLKYRKGYVPVVRKNDNYYVVRHSSRTVDNAPVAYTSAVRSFESVHDAKAYAKIENAKGGDKYEDIVRDQLTERQSIDKDTMRRGGLFFGSRSSNKIHHVLEGDLAPRIDALEALSRNLGAAGRAYPMALFREQLKAKFLNTYKDLLEDPNKFDSPFKQGFKSRAVIGGEAYRNWVKDVIGVPTPDEEVFSAVVRQTTEWAEGIGRVGMKRVPSGFGGKEYIGKAGAVVRNSLLNLSTKDPYAALRAGAFHPMLGMFNPAQLLIQAQNFSIAASLDPQGVASSFRQFTAMRTALMAPAAMNDAKTLARLADVAGMSPKDFKAMVKEVDSIGIKSSIRANPDYAAAMNGTILDGKYFKSFLDKGIIPFQEGELFSRLYAYSAARREFLKKNKRADGQLSAEDIEDITDRYGDLTLNMLRENRAYWNKGALSLPTQFMSAQAKFLETVLGNRMSGQDKRRIFAGQALLYGSAGVPLGGYISGLMKGEGSFMGINATDENGNPNPEFSNNIAIQLFDQGLSGQMFGGKSDVATRFSLIDGLMQTGKDLVQGNLGELLSFPVATSGSRALDAVTTLGLTLNNAVTTGYDLTYKDALLTARAFSDVASGPRAFMEAIDYVRFKEIRTASGRLVANDPEAWEVLGKAWGMQPMRASQMYDQQEQLHQLTADERGDTDRLRMVVISHIRSGKIDEEQEQRNLAAITTTILNKYKVSEREKIMATVVDQVFPGAQDMTTSEKTLKDILNRLSKLQAPQAQERTMFNNLNTNQGRP